MCFASHACLHDSQAVIRSLTFGLSCFLMKFWLYSVILFEAQERVGYLGLFPVHCNERMHLQHLSDLNTPRSDAPGCDGSN